MTPNVVILCAAGMLVTAYLMVGQKALFTAIRLYGVQSLLLATVAVAMAISDQRPHLFVMAALTIGAEGRSLIPLVPDAGRSIASASTARSSRSSTCPRRCWSVSA